MASQNAHRDNNRVPGLLAESNTTAGELVRVTADPTTGAMSVLSTTLTPGTGASNLGKAEDAAHTSGDVGVMALTVRSDTAAATANTTGDYQPQITDATGNTWIREYYAPGYEDNTNNVAKVEQRFSYVAITGDTAVKSGSGFLHTVTFAPNDSAPTAGSIIIYDNTAESGTQIFNWSGITTTWFVPFTLTFDVSFSTGLYVGFTTTGDVNVTVSYR